MPISQSRMLALIAAATDYERAWVKVQNHYHGIADRLQSRHITLEQAWAELDFMFTSQLHLSDPANTFKTIAAESAHFKATAKRNEKSAQWQREKRNGRPPKRQIYNHSQQPASQPALHPMRNTDLEQVGNDSDLFGGNPEPETISPEAKASIEQFLAEAAKSDQPAPPVQPDLLDEIG